LSEIALKDIVSEGKDDFRRNPRLSILLALYLARPSSQDGGLQDAVAVEVNRLPTGCRAFGLVYLAFKKCYHSLDVWFWHSLSMNVE
jgi:hypothetical protein